MTRVSVAVLAALLLGAGASTNAWTGAASAQEARALPGFARHAEMAPKLAHAFISGAVTPRWSADGSSFTYTQGDQSFRYDVAALSASIAANMPDEAEGAWCRPPRPVEGAPVLARGRGADSYVVSPDGKSCAFTRDRNLFVARSDGGAEVQITHDGSAAGRIRHGVGSYLYLEEFAVRSPVWWSPDGKKLAWLRFDERQVDDYFVELDQTKTFSNVLAEAYPHPGRPNPISDLMVHDFATGATTQMEVRTGAGPTDDAVGHYAWDAAWTPDGSALTVRRMDRRQKIAELAACDPLAGGCRTIAREERPQSWVDTESALFLKDGKHFLWLSDRNGFRNIYLFGNDGKQIAEVTRHRFDIDEIVHVDETSQRLWYTAHSGDNPMKVQLHVVRLDGRDDRRLTDPTLHHVISFAPDGKHFVDAAQTHNVAPVSTLYDREGRKLAEIARSDTSGLAALGAPPAELFSFKAADGVTPLWGLIQKPTGFDPMRQWPVLVQVYGGPGSSNGARETYQPPSALAEYGFVIVRVDARTAAGRGRAGLDAYYGQAGQMEADDIAAGVRSLWMRSWVDRRRVGVAGTSYGGTMAATLLIRYPDVFSAAVANSPVTDWRLYDSAYTERYLGLPDQNQAAYDRASLVQMAGRLEAPLMLYYGTADDNVHPKNTLQFIRALQTAGKSFEVQVGPDKGHTSVDQARMMEFFVRTLVMEKRPAIRPAPLGTLDPASGPHG